MQRFARDHDRVLQSSAQAIGLPTLVVSMLCMAVPGVLPVPLLLAVIPFYGIAAACLIRIGWSRSLIWVVPGILSCLVILVVAQLPLSEATPSVIATSMVPLAGGTLPAFAFVLLGSPARMAILVGAFISSVLLMRMAVGWPATPSLRSMTVWLGWVLAVTFVYWLRASMNRASRKVLEIGRAHQVERQSSEIEAQRRQSARLLHDTVLATLTLLAHSGVGVSATALKEQARNDAELLRQLRVGSPSGSSSTVQDYSVPVEESTLGQTLVSVKQRFARMGLTVSWHGTGQVLLPIGVLDAFLLALAECLENVRRHSGVTDAHVTITDDDTTVRAMVTDSGVGFTLIDIDGARLGFRESVVGRLKEVGGNARLFSSPGSGTTVVLEVPK